GHSFPPDDPTTRCVTEAPHEHPPGTMPFAPRSRRPRAIPASASRSGFHRRRAPRLRRGPTRRRCARGRIAAARSPRRAAGATLRSAKRRAVLRHGLIAAAQRLRGFETISGRPAVTFWYGLGPEGARTKQVAVSLRCFARERWIHTARSSMLP